MSGTYICKILVVTADTTTFQEIRDLFHKRRVLGSVGFYVEREGTMEGARKRLAQEQWNIVFFEVDYPGENASRDGIQCMIEFQEGANACPSVLLTGQDNLHVPARLLQLFQDGCVRFVPKSQLAWQDVQRAIADFFPTYIHALILDDDPDDRELLGARLGELLQGMGGSTIDVVSDLRAARQNLMAARYDLAILDRRLGPDTSGFELLPALHRNNDQMGIILCTGMESTILSSDEVRAISHGKIKFVHKQALLEKGAEDLIFSVTGILRWDRTRQRPV